MDVLKIQNNIQINSLNSLNVNDSVNSDILSIDKTKYNDTGNQILNNEVIDLELESVSGEPKKEKGLKSFLKKLWLLKLLVQLVN